MLTPEEQAKADQAVADKAAADAAAAAQPSVYDDLAAKKGIKNQDEFAGIYVENEKEMSRRANVIDNAKKQLEAAGYEMDDTGKIVQKAAQPGAGQPAAQPQIDPNTGYPVQQPAGGGHYQQPGEPIYDPYTGLQITNPLDIALAGMPVSQRMAVVTNAIMDQREKNSREANTAADKVLSAPEAKGFEEDVRKVMLQLPLQQRSSEQAWSDALLRVKGMRYDQMKLNAGQQGVDEFINKGNAQPFTGGQAPSGGAGGAKLSPDQEKQFQFYKTNHPNMFKDRAHFAKRLSATGA